MDSDAEDDDQIIVRTALDYTKVNDFERQLG